MVPPDPSQDLAMLDMVTGWLSAAMSFVGPTMLDHPTPCADWDVRALLDHVTGGNRFTVHILNGLGADAALAATIASFESPQNSISAVVESAAHQRRSFAVENVMSETFHHVVGDLTGTQILRLRIHDMSIHIWDVLQAVHPKKGLDARYVRWALAELSSPDSLTARHIATGYPAPTKSYELLLAFGRRRRPGPTHLRNDA